MVNMKYEIGLVACTSKKENFQTWARELYSSEWFKKASDHADENFDAWWILSAKHGLVHISDVINPYEKRLSTKKADKEEWSEMVIGQWMMMLVEEGLLEEELEVTFLAGKDYRENLEGIFSNRPELQTSKPLEGLGIGQQLSWFNNQI
jgi:hypothetical protein